MDESPSVKTGCCNKPATILPIILHPFLMFNHTLHTHFSLKDFFHVQYVTLKYVLSYHSLLTFTPRNTKVSPYTSSQTSRLLILLMYKLRNAAETVNTADR